MCVSQGIQMNVSVPLPKPSKETIDYIKSIIDWQKRSANNQSVILYGNVSVKYEV